MTKHIRKNAPAGAEYFKIVGNHISYMKCDEHDSVLVYDQFKREWLKTYCLTRADLHAQRDCHSLHALPSWVLVGSFIVAVLSAVAWSKM